MTYTLARSSKEMTSIVATARLIITRAILHHGLKGRVKKYSVEQLANFLLDIVEGRIEEFTEPQAGLWRQLEADYQREVREEKAREEGRLC